MKQAPLVIAWVAGLCGSLLAQEPNDPAAEAERAYARGEFSECARLYEQAMESGAQNAILFYNAACCHALAGNPYEALRLLERAVDAGFRNAGHMSRDSDLTSLHDDPRWSSTLARIEKAEEARGRALCRPLQFDQSEAVKGTSARSFRWSGPDDPYLVRLRTHYRLAQVVDQAASDYEKVRAVCRWVRTRWEHNGMNEPAKSDPISVLQEAEAGKRFRCVEYAIVLSGALNSLGIPSRVVALKTRDAETRPSGAGHVVAESYVPDIDKWIMVDGQWDVVPVSNGTPLNAVELQRALAEGDTGLSVDSFSNTRASEYFDWIVEYLFYFSVSLDNRYGVETEPDQLMLVPVGAKNPTVFQQKYPIRNTVYTHALRLFYSRP